ncbi:hypothetical protein AEQ67_09865 [Pseudomonas sp. RIT-PI-q]|uniref:hypothetical protein n=1 Tax=Pseudomonas sp. RIT-PI-q TaxID=1690247 RepID=UPI0006CDAEDD|nr:hypothetical protein [Pseudomonas sp. RIT-PI-q]KPG99434.1 hypothetical protein AEQ67_09865 [Pseudomonas sp. RIT-PI-q]
MNAIVTHKQRMARYQTRQPVTLNYRKDPNREHSVIDLQGMYYDVLAVFNKHMDGVAAQERAEFASIVRALVTCYLEESNDGRTVRVLENTVHSSVVAKLVREELCRLVGAYVPEDGEGSVEVHNQSLRQRQQLADAAYAECRIKHPAMTIDMSDLTTAEALLKSLGFLESLEGLDHAQG